MTARAARQLKFLYFLSLLFYFPLRRILIGVAGGGLCYLFISFAPGLPDYSEVLKLLPIIVFGLFGLTHGILVDFQLMQGRTKVLTVIGEHVTQKMRKRDLVGTAAQGISLGLVELRLRDVVLMAGAGTLAGAVWSALVAGLVRSHSEALQRFAFYVSHLSIYGWLFYGLLSVGMYWLLRTLLERFRS